MTTPRPVSELPSRPEAAVRVLHTSDWHLGVSVRNTPRDVDHNAVIAEISDIATVAAPDVIVHTGDLFHGGRPGMADFARAIRALRELSRIAPVVVLAGNHDSSVALETLGIAVEDPVPALVAGGVYDPATDCPARVRVLHRPAPAANGGVMTFPTAAGGKLRLVGLPFLHANRTITDFEDIVTSHANYTDSMAAVCNRLTQAAFNGFDPTTDVAVFASHLHVAGARTSSEKEIHISTEYATDPAHLDSGFGYLAFGHIHIAQAVAGGQGRYAGSILEVDFGEEGETKQVVVADLVPSRPTEIHDVALASGRRLHRIRTPYSAIASHAVTVGDGLVEVTIQLEPDRIGSNGPSQADGGSELVSLDIPGFDNLTDAVNAALPDATIVGILDARRPDTAAADEIELPDGDETVGELFRAWMADHGSSVTAKTTAHNADLDRVCALFDEIHAAVTTDSDVALAEQAKIENLVTAEELA